MALKVFHFGKKQHEKRELGEKRGGGGLDDVGRRGSRTVDEEPF